jgi:hypothetical protein
MKLYDERDIEEQGEHYYNHVNQMTAEDLHSKSAIAAELAHRDIINCQLQSDNKRMLDMLKFIRDNGFDNLRQDRFHTLINDIERGDSDE